MQLRRLAERDSLKAFQIRNHESVYRWCRQWAPLHWSGHEAWLKAQASDRSMEMFAIDEAGEFIGVCGLTSIDHINSRAEFSLYIDPYFHRRGLGHKALIELFKIGFFKLNLNRIWGETFAGNPALSLFKKIGLKEEGVRKEFYYRDGSYVDCHLVSMSRREFSAYLSGEEDSRERAFYATSAGASIPVF